MQFEAPALRVLMRYKHLQGWPELYIYTLYMTVSIVISHINGWFWPTLIICNPDDVTTLAIMLCFPGNVNSSAIVYHNTQAVHFLELPPHISAGVQLYFLWLGYFYLAAALRENVLLVNGSHIKSWWIQHHCWSAACALLMLGLPVYSQGGGVKKGGWVHR